MLYHYLVTSTSRGDLVHASFVRVRCALTALARRLALRQSVRLVACPRRFEIGQLIADWSEWEEHPRISVEGLPKSRHLVEQLPEEFGADWWNEYIS